MQTADVRRLSRDAVLLALAAACAAGAAAVALGLSLRTLDWPLIVDAPLMHYIAAHVLRGAVPYRDLFDMNFPGVYLAHMLGLVLFGPGDAGFRALDFTLLAGILAGLGVALRPFGRWAPMFAGTLFWLYHVADGPENAAQRDVIVCLPLAWTAAAAVAYAGSGRPLTIGLGGLALGAAMWVKPHTVLLLPALVTLVWCRPSGARQRAATALAVGLAVPAVAVLSWLAVTGGLGPFLDIVSGYLVPLYSRLGGGLLRARMLRYAAGMPEVSLWLWAAGGLVALWRLGCLDARALLLSAGVCYGAIHFILQGKGWHYHLYPLVLFAIALGAAGLGASLQAARGLGAAVLLVLFILATGAFTSKGVGTVAWRWWPTWSARVHGEAAALGRVIGRDGTVQVLDTAQGGIHALYLLGARQPTRFLYDFHFYHDVDHAYVRRLRKEMLDGLRSRPPAAVLVYESGWTGAGYRRLDRFPELAQWLASVYRLADEGPGYRIYARQDGPAVGGSQ